MSWEQLKDFMSNDWVMVYRTIVLYVLSLFKSVSKVAGLRESLGLVGNKLGFLVVEKNK